MARFVRGSSQRNALREIAPILGLGVQFAVIVSLGVAGGHWIDGRYGVDPWGIVSGGVAGIAVGFYHFLRAVWPRAGGRERKDCSDDAI